jgi:hypothetical protein
MRLGTEIAGSSHPQTGTAAKCRQPQSSNGTWISPLAGTAPRDRAVSSSNVPCRAGGHTHDPSVSSSCAASASPERPISTKTAFPHDRRLLSHLVPCGVVMNAIPTIRSEAWVTPRHADVRLASPQLGALGPPSIVTGIPARRPPSRSMPLESTTHVLATRRRGPRRQPSGGPHIVTAAPHQCNGDDSSGIPLHPAASADAPHRPGFRPCGGHGVPRRVRSRRRKSTRGHG